MRFFLIAAALTATLGAAALAVASSQPSWIDSSGILREPFAWMASGRILLLLTGVLLLAATTIWMIGKTRG